jgi:hypothetical protein
MNELLQLLSLADSNKTGLDLANQQAKIGEIITVVNAQAQEIQILRAQAAGVDSLNGVVFGIIAGLIVFLGALIAVQWYWSAKRIKGLESQLDAAGLITHAATA